MRALQAACTGCVGSTVTLPEKLPAVEAHSSGDVAQLTAEYSLMARS